MKRGFLLSSCTRRLAELTALVVLILTFCVPAAGASASVPLRDPLVPERAYFGALLNWGSDSAAGYAKRTGISAALYGQSVPMPMNSQEQVYLKAYFSQIAAEGAHALVTVEPRQPLVELDAAAAATFARQVADASAGFSGAIYLRFAPEMNAPWVAWGQQPAAYRAAFAAVASAVRPAVNNAAMVWAPAAGGDYPFREATTEPPGGASMRSLDTSGDGVWNGDDDAYAPYYPGDEFTDWAGLSIYHDPTNGGPAKNELPVEGGFAAELDPAASGPGENNFYRTYGEARGKPLMVETGAYYSPGSSGEAEADIKNRWSDQVITAMTDGKRPALRAMVWNETVEAREGGITIDWRVGHAAGLAAAFQAMIETSSLTVGPVTDRAQKVVPAVEAPREIAGTVLTGWAAWAAAGAALLAVVLLWAVSRRAMARAWAYDGSFDDRDARIDLMRGVAIVFVVVNHVGITSAFQLLTQETIGVVSGAELFVLLSGVVVGMVYGPRARKDLGEVVDRTSKRAGRLYATALTVALAIYALSLLPFVNATAVTTFTDQSDVGVTGAMGTTYDLYAGMEGLLQFPVPQGLIPALLLLQVGPWQFNVIGLYVILLLASPLILAALTRGFAWLVLTVSAVLYALGSIFHFRLLPSQFEDSFPLLVWQVLFVLGTIAGYYRHPLVEWFSHPRQRVFLGTCLLMAAGCAVFSWTGPYLTNDLDVRLDLLSEQSFGLLYDGFFDRTYLGPGRLVNVLVVGIAFYAFITAYWKPLDRALGWFLIPLGQATLYVFIMHVFVIMVTANIPALRQGNVWLNTAAYILLLGLLWTMVRARFLFRLIPR
ncbi:OpgC domain-containing protein [Pseudarthrobacter sp. NPDC092424]|uniref:OpgC domain-containing protein n=1 Tax=Pseudarthrobacter sp. NPDC092424 TaxID=3364415 RepID=UPI0037F4D9AB